MTHYASVPFSYSVDFTIRGAKDEAEAERALRYHFGESEASPVEGVTVTGPDLYSLRGDADLSDVLVEKGAD